MNVKKEHKVKLKHFRWGQYHVWAKNRTEALRKLRGFLKVEEVQ